MIHSSDTSAAMEDVQYLFHHLFLPPKLPGGDDNSAKHDFLLVDFVLLSLKDFLSEAEPDDCIPIKTCIGMMESMKGSMSSSGYLNESGVKDALSQLFTEGSVVVFYINAQNAGVLVNKTTAAVCFETFELSPTNHSVMVTQGRLIREFPANAINISVEDFENNEFRTVIANTLVKMSNQPVHETKEKARKAQQDHVEERDTTDPRIVTELLASILQGLGKQVNVNGIRKHTREEVMWSNSKLPWRRSPLWLLIRVTLQLIMARHTNASDNLYKPFMAFLMAKVLDLAIHQPTPSDDIHTMMSKISRRLCKLERLCNESWIQIIKDTISKSSNILKQRWKKICQISERPLHLQTILGLDMMEGIKFSLPELETFISSIPLRYCDKKRSTFSPVSHIPLIEADVLPSMRNVKKNEYLAFQLAMIETWIASHLDQWLKVHIQEESTCQNLANLIRRYHSEASALYSKHPENASRMLLTIGELWIAADKAAIHAHPMLKDYDPEVPTQVWQALFLSSFADMERLHRLETYLVDRHRFASTKRLPSPFRSYGDSQSFPVRYFAQSAMHQDMKKRIEDDAEVARNEKLGEFQLRQMEYARLKHQYDTGRCEFMSWTEYDVRVTKHDPNCSRCRALDTATKMKISVHEWPLPENTGQAKAVVFELDVPRPFAEWRDATIYFVDEVLLCEPLTHNRPKFSNAIRTYDGLMKYFKSGQHRVHLLSEAKSHLRTHRRDRVVGYSSQSDVCVKNGLRFQYYDEERQCFLSASNPTVGISRDLCTFTLPARAEALQPFLMRTWEDPNGKTSNDVIASQSLCPEYLSTEEFKALCVLPYGFRLTWMSILTQLAMPTIDFNKPETATFLLQLSLQAGPNSLDIARCAHAQPFQPVFGDKILQNLETCIMRIEENWESNTALCSFILLATRLLSLVSKNLRPSFLDLLQRCRKISHEWLVRLIEKVQDTTDDAQRQEFSEILLTIALICADSFNVEDLFMREILEDSYQASILVEASIIIYNNSSLRKSDTNIIQGFLFDRWLHTMHRARSIFCSVALRTENSCLDLAVQRRWPDFRPTGNWRIAKSTCHWFETTFSNRRVHLDILRGSLLVDGLPLSRLPSQYEGHNDYERLFGASVLEVMPSSLPGMGFSTTKSFRGYAVHFGMQDSAGNSPQDLLVHLNGNGASLDLIPPRTLKGLLPYAFVNNYTHWYNNDTGVIELRPLENTWSPDPHNWRLSRCGKSWNMTRQDKIFLIAPSSPLAQRLSVILSPLEEPLSLHILYAAVTCSLEIQVPRLHLDFFLNSGDASPRSKQYRDMEIDADQSVGTLVGLASKIVLRNRQDQKPRMLIIPQGDVQYDRADGGSVEGHINVWVTYGSSHRVQAYQIDNLLGRLTANNKVENKLYLAYLHALTSFCLPDPFLRRTGTEQALEILLSASVRAPCRLTKVMNHILNLIAGLAPIRKFYPKHERLMQDVTWSSKLSYLSQDCRFFKITRDILQGSNEINFLYTKDEVFPPQPTNACLELVKRSIIRRSSQHVSGFGAEDFTTKYDVRYEPRDRIRSDRGIRAVGMAFRIFNNHQTRFQSVSSNLATYLYELMSVCDILSAKMAPSKADMNYDSRWFQSPQEILSSYWCQLHYAFQRKQLWLNKFELIIWMSTISYSPNHEDQITQALLMLALSPSVSDTLLPKQGTYSLSQGYVVSKGTLIEFANQTAKSISQCPDATLKKRPHESGQETLNRRHKSYDMNKSAAISSFTQSLAVQWPSARPRTPQGGSVATYIDIHTAMISVSEQWTVWWHNLHFMNYLISFVNNLETIPMETMQVESLPSPIHFVQGDHHQGFVSVDDLFSQHPPDQHSDITSFPDGFLQEAESNDNTSEKLSVVLNFLDYKAKLAYEHRYLKELRESIASLEEQPTKELIEGHSLNKTEIFGKYHAQCESRVELVYNSIVRALTLTQRQGASVYHLSEEAKDWNLGGSQFLPRISPFLLLQQLRQSKWHEMTHLWQKAILDYGLAIAALQRARRLLRFQNDPTDLLRELENTGHTGWDPKNHPEWLLLECESEIMIREVQQQIAEQMTQPPNNENAVMQLNMGEGKSSVIVPIVASALGDGSRLVRVIVAKPQAKQMHQMLVSKLSGLLDRPIYEMPFSRDVKICSSRADVIHRLVTKCMQEGGVLMVQPEHLLSFQLMELDCRLSGGQAVADKMMKTRQFFEASSRDVVDESDENFSVKFELVYTLGQQQPIEHSPDRWTIIQQVLGLVRDFCSRAKSEFPQSLEVDERDSARFPKIRILRSDAEKRIITRVARHICETGITGFPISHQHPAIREAIFQYITRCDLSSDEMSNVETSSFWVESTINHMLLLRGLFSGGILAFALGQKRWRVNYGTDPNRETKTKLAVPFRAKDNPTPRSEFSHPDVVITLTCLSYYYGGLDDEALFSAFELLVRSDNCDQEYQSWARTAPNLPEAFKHLQGINIRDCVHCKTEVFPHLRYSKAAIDYYLSRMVFAKESKEFPHKLSASGWDLGKIKCNPTTGFSGTNDSRYVLPLSITQLDIKEQKHTNALVLGYLLRPDNGIALMPPDMGGATFDSKTLLQLVAKMSKNTRVILDVGAQVIDLDNLEFARAWLSCYMEDSDEHPQAVIFFNDHDELAVLHRSGKVEEFQTSPFADKLDQCLIFLDEAHTRGTDLKLPVNYQAAVTLGANLTKDRLVQACMRMRKLGKGQTVVFCIPREIEVKIRQLRDNKSVPPAEITASDVLCWAITETCTDLRRAVPLWLNQGVRFHEQQVFWKELGLAVDHETRVGCSQLFMEDEAQSLDTRYRPRQSHPSISSLLGRLGSHISGKLNNRCQEFGLTEIRTSSLQEEQERELSPETEQERQIERPPPANPMVHRLHPDLLTLVTEGRFLKKGKAFEPAFKTLRKTSAANHFNLQDFPHKIWVTGDFSNTINCRFGLKNYSDAFQRPVQWILTRTVESGGSGLIIISPYEVQELLPSITDSNFVTLHLYTPRVNLGFKPLDQLDLYSIPKNMAQPMVSKDTILHLNLFAGQLYLSSFDEYIRLCDTLGLAWKAADESVILGPDGFIPPGIEEVGLMNHSGFLKSPVQFLKVLNSKIRHECEAINKTHVGRILEGERLDEREFSKSERDID